MIKEFIHVAVTQLRSYMLQVPLRKHLTTFLFASQIKEFPLAGFDLFRNILQRQTAKICSLAELGLH